MQAPFIWTRARLSCVKCQSIASITLVQSARS